MGIFPKQGFKIKKNIWVATSQNIIQPHEPPKVNQQRRLASSKKRFRTTSKVLFSGTFETLFGERGVKEPFDKNMMSIGCCWLVSWFQNDQLKKRKLLY